jgi:putative SOS response-associated peptidase YedK
VDADVLHHRTTANELVGQIHDRMPVMLPPDAYDRWLANIEPIRVIYWCRSCQN